MFYATTVCGGCCSAGWDLFYLQSYKVSIVAVLSHLSQYCTLVHVVQAISLTSKICSIDFPDVAITGLVQSLVLKKFVRLHCWELRLIWSMNNKAYDFW